MHAITDTDTLRGNVFCVTPTLYTDLERIKLVHGAKCVSTHIGLDLNLLVLVFKGPNSDIETCHLAFEVTCFPTENFLAKMADRLTTVTTESRGTGVVSRDYQPKGFHVIQCEPYCHSIGSATHRRYCASCFSDLSGYVCTVEWSVLLPVPQNAGARARSRKC